jgi:hypothetical protein
MIGNQFWKGADRSAPNDARPQADRFRGRVLLAQVSELVTRAVSLRGVRGQGCVVAARAFRIIALFRGHGSAIQSAKTVGVNLQRRLKFRPRFLRPGPARGANHRAVHGTG